MGSRVCPAPAGVLRAAGRRRGALVGIALAEYALVSLAFPLAAGRDLGTYLRASFELRADEVVLPQALLAARP